jgi:hypothetical protein
MAGMATGFLLLVPAAGAQVPAVQLPAVPGVDVQAPANPVSTPQSAISGQYHAIAKAVERTIPPVAAAPHAPAPVSTPAPKPPATPEYHPAQDRYHSEPPADVSVTQTQPQNVNVSIRVNSPGDDGPVVQVNGAGSDVQTDIVQAPAAPRPEPETAPAPAEPSPPSALPDDWTWVWTSACFGGGGSPPAALASAGGPHWDWRWSCEQPTHGIPIPDGFPGSGALPSTVPAVGVPMPLSGAPPPDPRPDRARHSRAAPSVAAAPVAAGAAVLAAAPRVAAAAAPAVKIASRVAGAARRAVQAKARPAGGGTTSDFIPGGGGQSAGAAGGLGAAMSLLLGTWLAALVLALSLVIPRMWLRRWSGPPWRWPFAPSSRLERPG